MKRLLLIQLLSVIGSASIAQTIEQEVIKQINSLRLQMGGRDSSLNPFKRNTALDSAAMYHAKWVVASGIRSHIETKTVAGIKALAEPWDRAAKYGVTAYAENLIQYSFYVKNGNAINNRASAERAFYAWKKSRGHYENMLFKTSQKVEPRIGIAVLPQDEFSFCIVIVIGANVDKSGNLTK